MRFKYAEISKRYIVCYLINRCLMQKEKDLTYTYKLREDNRHPSKCARILISVISLFISRPLCFNKICSTYCSNSNLPIFKRLQFTRQKALDKFNIPAAIVPCIRRLKY